MISSCHGISGNLDRLADLEKKDESRKALWPAGEQGLTNEVSKWQSLFVGILFLFKEMHLSKSINNLSASSGRGQYLFL